MWKHPCAQVIFDTDPATAGKSTAEQMEEISQAIIWYLSIYIVCIVT